MRRLGSAFERSWLTAAEAAFLQQNQVDMTVADIWAMKEAVYKACNRGEAFTPRSIEIHLAADGTTVRYHGHNLRNRCRVRVWRWGDEVAAVATYRRLGIRKHERPTNSNESSNSLTLRSLP
jgi:phosphopantetheinyl transferase